MASAMRGLFQRITQSKDHDRAESLADSAGSHNLSRHSSIQGPYRAGLQDNIFPLYSTVDVPVGSGDIFARSLFSLGFGVGLHGIIGDIARPAEHRYNGAFIGDVGTMNELGSFSYSFNIFLPPNHPRNDGLLPEGFAPLHIPIAEEDTTHVDNFLRPGAVLVTEGIDVAVLPDSPSQMRFKTSVREGAVVVLPSGAAREEFVNPSKMYPYFKEHAAASWYRYYNGDNDMIASEVPAANGTIWVVVGVDRVRSWATATFPVQAEDAGKPKEFVYNAENQDSPWENHTGLCGPEFEAKILSDGSQGALFLRVVAIALSPSEWSRHVAYVPPESVECYSTLPVPIVGRRTRAYYSAPRLSRFLKRNTLRMPKVSFHPSIPLLHVLILTDSTAQVAAVPDSVWISQLTKRHLTHPEIVQLMRRVIDNYDIVNTDGLVTFVPTKQNEGDAVAPESNSKRKYQGWFFHQILSWLRKEKDESPRGRALRNMSKVLST